ncbi:MAG: NADH-quinone oxidoreductase subunit I [Ignavibacteriales bacterium]
MEKTGVLYQGYPSEEELGAVPGFPPAGRFRKGPVAVLECVQQIPCNPCEAACPRKAITVGEDITALPVLDPDKCTGCGSCIAACPGQAVFVVDMGYSDNEALVSFPYEFLPLPAEGDHVDVVSRAGEVVGRGRVTKVRRPKSYDRTAVITVAVPKGIAHDVRSMARLRGQT